ncbi:MAG: trimethylamine methyltransferase family protein [Candidatus Marinimicrobia bacterium]|nr:trimethylamine methyltransferase family protein [Candidatus Neomarinimicrobiota bacterium]MCF7851042.1 trimethylamine methyltransferase family protein [Candidatus Neomarinimicrobiota bacterium]
MTHTALPRLSLLNEHQIQELHAASLELLCTTGITVKSPQALEIFASSESTTIEGNTVLFESDLIETCIEQAPSSIQIYDRHKNPSFKLGPDVTETVFGIGVTNTHFQDPETEDIVPFARQHIAQATRLGNSLENFALISTPGVIEDPQLKNGEVLAALEMLANTTKPLVILSSNTGAFRTSLDLFDHLIGDLAAHPFIIPYVNPITPLILNAGTTDKMIMSIQKGLPLIYSSYGMSGATTPITAGGTLALQNAELLAGLVFTQLVKAGTPVILGCLPSVFEMHHMTSAYTPQTMLVNLACAEMMHYYGIPHAGTSGSGAGWGADLSAGGLLWMNHLTSMLGKVGMAPFVGGNFDSLVFSSKLLIYANEVIRQLRLFSDGLDLSKEKIDLNTIQETGPGGNFLQTDQTLTLFREIHEQHNRIWPGISLDDWFGQGSPHANDILQTYVDEVLGQLITPPDHRELISKGEAWITENNPSA